VPNYPDVARFRDVNPFTSLYFFDGRFRPVPLAQSFISYYLSVILKDYNTIKIKYFDLTTLHKLFDRVHPMHIICVFERDKAIQ